MTHLSSPPDRSPCRRRFGLGAVGSIAIGLSCLACRDIDRFDTSGDAAYCGDIVNARFVRTVEDEGGFERNLRLRVEIDPDALNTLPGTLTSDDAEVGPCAPNALFQDTALRPVPEVAHDPLSTMTFDEAQEHNIVAWVDSACRGPMLAVISLLKNGRVEVRLLTPPPVAPIGDERAAFALFELERRESGCGF